MYVLKEAEQALLLLVPNPASISPLPPPLGCLRRKRKKLQHKLRVFLLLPWLCNTWVALQWQRQLPHLSLRQMTAGSFTHLARWGMAGQLQGGHEGKRQSSCDANAPFLYCCAGSNNKGSWGQEKTWHGGKKGQRWTTQSILFFGINLLQKSFSDPKENAVMKK